MSEGDCSRDQGASYVRGGVHTRQCQESLLMYPAAAATARVTRGSHMSEAGPSGVHTCNSSAAVQCGFVFRGSCLVCRVSGLVRSGLMY